MVSIRRKSWLIALTMTYIHFRERGNSARLAWQTTRPMPRTNTSSIITACRIPGIIVENRSHLGVVSRSEQCSVCVCFRSGCSHNPDWPSRHPIPSHQFHLTRCIVERAHGVWRLRLRPTNRLTPSRSKRNKLHRNNRSLWYLNTIEEYLSNSHTPSWKDHFPSFALFSYHTCLKRETPSGFHFYQGFNIICNTLLFLWQDEWPKRISNSVFFF